MNRLENKSTAKIQKCNDHFLHHQIHRNYPPLPPSPSAAVIPKAKSVAEWVRSVRTIFSNKAFIIIFIFLGACMGCVSSVMTKIEQIMCSRGYSDQLSGLAGAMILTR